MTQPKRSAIRLTSAAENDLSDIWRFTARTWSIEQADAYLRGLDAQFDALSRHPEMAREFSEIDPPVRLFPFRSHVIIYRVEEAVLVVLRVLHNRRHWRTLLDG